MTFEIYNATTVAVVATRTDTFATLGTVSVVKWKSLEYASWNGTDTIYPRMFLAAVGGGGTMVVDLALFANIDSGAGNNGPKSLANDATTENTVWPENARVGV